MRDTVLGDGVNDVFLLMIVNIEQNRVAGAESICKRLAHRKINTLLEILIRPQIDRCGSRFDIVMTADDRCQAHRHDPGFHIAPVQTCSGR